MKNSRPDRMPAFGTAEKCLGYAPQAPGNSHCAPTPYGGRRYAVIHRISCDQNDALPAECLVLIFKPGECVLKMLRIKIWPIFIPDVEIRINRLHREKTAQSASSSPAYNQIQT